MGMPARRIIGAQQHERSACRVGQSISQHHNTDVLPMGKREHLKRQEMMQYRA